MASSESPFSSTSSSYRRRPNYDVYDVFLSSGAGGSRKHFTDHLYHALIQAGIRTFKYNDELPGGEEISPQLLRAIEGSRISVVVFSRSYASSRWCLDQLVKIMECRQKTHQVVLPIFYGTDPSDVRKQTGSYAKAFDEHEKDFKEEMEKVNRWREALTQAANLSGRVLNKEANGFEAKLIKMIVNDVASILVIKTRIEMTRPKSGWTDATSASEQEQNNVDMAQQREPLLTGEFEQRKGIEMASSNIERFWNHVEQTNDGILQCKFCGHRFAKGTSLSRIKWHLSGERGHGVRICGQVPKQVQEAAFLSMHGGNSTHKTMGKRRKRIVIARSKSGRAIAISAYAQEQNNVDMAQQREPLLTGEFERANDLSGAGIELPRDTPDDQDELKKLKGSKSRDMVDDLKSGRTDAISASEQEQNNVDMAQQREPESTGELELVIDLSGAGIELPRDTPNDQDELKKLKGSKSGDMVDDLKSGRTDAISASEQEQNNDDRLGTLSFLLNIYLCLQGQRRKMTASGWTLLMTNLILEIASAVFDQLGYALVGMVLAFVALLLATAELIYMERMAFVALLLSTAERMNLLPNFLLPRKESTFAPGKPDGTIVEYFGLVGAVWQCFYSTVEYAYARQKKDNPIKMCLLPFIFLLCVVISKVIKTEFIDDSA